MYLRQTTCAYCDIDRSGRASSIAVILSGSVYYTWVKHVESQPRSGSTVLEKDTYTPVPMEDIEDGKVDREQTTSN